ncbi:pathogenesis-related thaumatin superfamily protein [Artemisia annua]|uniref:Pathogenesis-related thaumatin superfamily protein n=1 Tax=Artemisia annua TaxID=35608 RepID=A0A2U1M7S3_ARTAN|nr:pathogenesis-related thaumatin superfamily protein [Artemisia annua]
MDLLSSSYTLTLVLTLSLLTKCVFGATFTFNNKCEYTVWPGILANAGSPSLSTTGFELPESSSRSFQAPTGWSGRFWGRTGCNFDGSGSGSCQTGDCGSNQVECNGAGAAPPATLAEFTLGTGGQKASRDTSPPAADTTDGPTNTTPSSGDEAISGSGAETSYGYALEANGSWLAGLAMGGSTTSEPFGATLPLFLFALFFL